MRACPECQVPFVELEKDWVCYRCGRCAQHDELVDSRSLCSEPVESLDCEREQEKRNADLNAVYARHLGRNGNEAARQEELIRDAREWARAELRNKAPSVSSVDELQELIVKQTWDRFICNHVHYADFRLGYREFTSALWIEGRPSLADVAADCVRYLSDAKAHAESADGLEWEDIKIVFLSDERVEIRRGEKIETRNYREMGFADGRTNKPNEQWAVLQLFARQEGNFPDSAREGKEWLAIMKRLERMRKTLKDLFKIDGDPVPYTEDIGYKTRFSITRSPAADK